jgi:tetratricopeptide (TPR) repeat protein
LYVWAGENDRAIEGAESAARLAADLPATGPANLWAIYLAELGMGDQLMVTNQVNAAVPHYRAALARCIEAARLDWLPHREVPVAHGRLGIALESRGELVEAHALFAEQLRVAEELSEAQPGDQRFLGEAMKAHELIGEVAGDPQVPNLADLPGARRHLEESLRIARRMRDRDPSDADANLAVAVELTRVAGLDIQPDPSRAVENLLQARALVEALQPSDIQKEKMSLVCGFLALAYSHQRQFGKAAAAAEDAERAASAAKSPILSEALCRAHGTSGRVALERGDRKMARAALELALACQAHEVAAAPEYLGDLFPYSELLSLLARAYADEPDKAGLYRLRRIQLWREWPIRGDFSAKQLAAALRDRG